MPVQDPDRQSPWRHAGCGPRGSHYESRDLPCHLAAGDHGRRRCRRVDLFPISCGDTFSVSTWTAPVASTLPLRFRSKREPHEQQGEPLYRRPGSRSCSEPSSTTCHAISLQAWAAPGRFSAGSPWSCLRLHQSRFRCPRAHPVRACRGAPGLARGSHPREDSRASVHWAPAESSRRVLLPLPRPQPAAEIHSQLRSLRPSVSLPFSFVVV
jgi:hypothetical protein